VSPDSFAPFPDFRTQPNTAFIFAKKEMFSAYLQESKMSESDCNSLSLRLTACPGSHFARHRQFDRDEFMLAVGSNVASFGLRP
jgi:hypothetical protein